VALTIEYEDIEHALSKGSKEVNWVAQEFAGVDLKDRRLNARLVQTATAIASAPSLPINGACGGNWAETKAAYRLFDNGKATPAAILKSHVDGTVRRMVACGDTVLAIQDTCFISYANHPSVVGIGPIGKDDKDRGLIMHSTVAFTTSGVALGLLSQRIWARDDIPNETPEEKRKRVSATALDEKESAKWLEALRRTRERTPPNVRVVTLADRESDFYEFIAAANAKSSRSFFVIRAVRDRKLVDDDNEAERISEALINAEIADTIQVKIVGNQKRQARTATVAVRYASVTIAPPQKRGKAKITATLEPLTVTAISAVEVNPPTGTPPISWVLLTNMGVTNAQSAVEKVRWYSRRFAIETWHRTLKSGFRVEKCLLETKERLQRYLTLASIIATRLMYITYIARVMPDLPATEVLTEEQWRTLHILVTKTKPPKEPEMTIQEAVRRIGAMGGHLGRKGDGEPGMTAMWRGILRLEAATDAIVAVEEMFPGLLSNTG
jgi:hypothetical protein